MDGDGDNIQKDKFPLVSLVKNDFINNYLKIFLF